MNTFRMRRGNTGDCGVLVYPSNQTVYTWHRGWCLVFMQQGGNTSVLSSLLNVRGNQNVKSKINATRGNKLMIIWYHSVAAVMEGGSWKKKRWH